MRAPAGLLRAAIAVLLIAIAIGACRTAVRVVEPPPPLDPTRFPHAAHAATACGECHDPRAAVRGAIVQPGKDDHAPCDRGNCHQVEFVRAPGPFCLVCHTAVDPRAPTASPVRAYPPDDGWRAMPARFAHAAHLDRGRMERAVGFHVACRDCHDADPTAAPAAYPRTGGHAECARCHAAEVGLARGPAMDDCAGCHGAGAVPRHARRLIRGDLVFDHRRHVTDIGGQRIACETCHDGTQFATGAADHAPPSIAACVACHDDTARVPGTQRMRICETCHTTRTQSVGTLAPRDHLPATEAPIDHTLAFRTDHGEAAAADPARCARCHTQMSGARADGCDECHQTMRPRDHNASWRELDHGTEVSADAQRCATCHVADFCTTCHEQLPRSHLPLEAFRTDHGGAARANPRACVTCHDPAATCGRCHPGEPPSR
ncbi:MAG: hypothetical protein K8W52_40665 [Deltaproteobacteria bacterium]|nr:hypothetical protein [Deltaproteobacteria bacterium]